MFEDKKPVPAAKSPVDDSFENELKEMPTIISMVPGSLETTFTEIKAPNLTVSQVAEAFLRLATLSDNKIFTINKVIAKNNLFSAQDPKKLDSKAKALPEGSYFKLILVNHSYLNQTGLSSRKIIVQYYDKNNTLLNAIEADRFSDTATWIEKPWENLSWAPFNENSFNILVSWLTIQSTFSGKTFLLPKPKALT